MAAKSIFPPELQEFEKRDTEVWFLALILLTGFAGGLVLFAYGDGLVRSSLAPEESRTVYLMLLGFLSLIVLLNIYLVGKKRSIHRMLSERLQLDEHLLQERKLSVTDALTGVYSRSYFDEVIPRELKRATRQKHGIALLLLDVDNFRRLNDEKGRGVGDYALRELVGILKQSLRATDYMFRFGGDEFLVALIEIKAGASEIVRHRIHQRLAGQIGLQHELGGELTLTIGEATFQADQTLDTLLKQASANLKSEKEKKMLRRTGAEDISGASAS